MDPEALFRHLSELAANRPDLRIIDDNYDTPEATQKWLGRLHALLEEVGEVGEALALRLQMGILAKSHGRAGRSEIFAILHRALASAELQAPTSAQGSFVAAGDEFEAFAKVARILEQAENDLLIVDPYLDEVALTDFAPMAREGIQIRLLGAEGRAKPTLEPAAKRWISQYAAKRPLDVRLADASAMHDRLILVDSKKAWLVTQSFKDFAKRSHGSIALADQEAAVMKIAAYEQIWNSGKQIL